MPTVPADPYTKALVDAHAGYAEKRPASKRLHDQAIEFLAGGNTRSVLYYRPFPTAMRRGWDCFLEDVDGHIYTDFCGEYTAGLFGHSDSLIRAALQGAIANGVNLAACGSKEQELARILSGRFPCLRKVRFTNSGTEANLMALATACFVTGRRKIIAFRGAYHGGSLSFPMSGSSPLNMPFDIVLSDYGDAEAAAMLIAALQDDLAAVIVEPMLGSGGCIPASRDFLATLRLKTTEAGSVLIFDEVMTSRMSSGGQQQRLGVTPDMMTLGKYVAGGVSFGAFGGRGDIMEAFGRDLTHSGTFNNNVLSMAAGVAAMGEVFTAERADALFALGEDLRATLNRMCHASGAEMTFTGLGSLLTPHFRTGPIVAPYKASAKEDLLRELFFFDMMASGIYLARRGMAALSLPVGTAEIAKLVAAVERFLISRNTLLGAAESMTNLPGTVTAHITK